LCSHGESPDLKGNFARGKKVFLKISIFVIVIAITRTCKTVKTGKCIKYFENIFE